MAIYKDYDSDSARIRRIETKLSRMADELGISVGEDTEWMTLDDLSRTIYLSSLGRSLASINWKALQLGAMHIGKEYELVHRGEIVGTIVLKGKGDRNE